EMSKRLIAVLALALVAGLAFAPAYAEVQNVKVSGDITATGLTRNYYGLNYSTTGDKSQFKQNLLMSQTRIRVDADLTDNVMATVRLINERVWNGQNDVSSSGNNAIDIDLAYATLKEFLYSPLSVTVGRQEIKFGNGLIMGNAKVASGVTNIPTDLSERKAFDAIRATLNYDPLVIDAIYAKVRQTSYSTTGTGPISDKNDINLMGVNATYAINKKANVSGYYYLKNDNYKGGAAIPLGGKSDKVNTVGALISVAPIDDLKASLEGAYQFGRNNATSLAEKNHDAWALQGLLDYTFTKIKMMPMVGASYTYLSGEKSDTIGNTRNGGWDPMFYDQKLNNITYTLLPFTNMSVFNLKASCKPMDDVTIAAVYGYYNVAQKKDLSSFTSPFFYDGTNGISNSYTGKVHLGDAIDLSVTYDYTEDVQLALTGGWFKPGEALTSNEKNATQLIGSMKVVF
ncbi:hypothetical protein EPN54_03255, partial [bacterium]